MTNPSVGQVTALLRAVRDGQPGATADLISLVYRELRQLACHQVARTPIHDAPHPTTLVHEVYLRLFGRTETTWQNRHHFFAVASRAMHDVIVEQARRYCAEKRGGGSCRRVELSADAAVREQSEQVLELSEALEGLSRVSFDAAHVVILRFFGGLSHLECADVLGMSEATVRRRWAFARAWLHRELANDISEISPKSATKLSASADR